MIDTNDAFETSEDGTYLHPILYKLDSTGRLRTWRMERNGNLYRTHSGLADGKQAVSGWTVAKAASQDSDEAQALFEVKAQYKHQLDREYHDNPDTVHQPKMIEPMLAKTYSKWPGPGYAQPKLDGIRCIMTAEGLFTRQGQPITAVPHLHAAAAPLFTEYPDLVLDGEMYNHDLRDDFGAISSIVRKKNPTAEQLELAERVMQYHIYDTVDTDSVFFNRITFLRTALRELNCDWLQLVETIRCSDETTADTSYGFFVEQGYEGGMYRLDAPYEIGKRSKTLLKRKEFMTEEFPILDIEEGNGNWAGAAKRVILKNNMNEGKPFGAGIRGQYPALKKLLEQWRAGNFPNAEATCRFFMRSPDMVPRFPVVVDLHLEGRKD